VCLAYKHILLSINIYDFYFENTVNEQLQVHSGKSGFPCEIEGDTKKREFLKCVVVAIYRWQHCGTGTLSYRQTCQPKIMEKWNGQQRAFAIKMFYKNNDSLEGAQGDFRRFFNLERHGQGPSKHAIKT